MAAVAHWQLPPFRELRLEDSFVLGIREAPGELRFDMEFVLGERHPSYRRPAPGQDQCYRRGRLVFRNVQSAEWSRRPDAPLSAADADDAEATSDLGTIDTFVLDGGAYKLRGRWGAVEVRASTVDVDVW